MLELTMTLHFSNGCFSSYELVYKSELNVDLIFFLSRIYSQTLKINKRGTDSTSK